MAVQPGHSLDSNTQGGFIKFYKSLPAKPNTTVQIFDRNEYYTVHGTDALLAAKEVYRTKSVIKYLGAGEDKLPSVILNKLNFERFVRNLLLVKQYRVEILRSKGKSNNEWNVEFKASPGNLQQLEDVLFSDSSVEESATCVMAISCQLNKESLRVVGVAYYESTTLTLGVSEFVDNDSFSNLETVLVQCSPRECAMVASDTSPDAVKIRNLVQRANTMVTERNKTDFKSGDISQDLGRLVKLGTGTSVATLAELDLRLAMSSLSALIKYLELLSDDSNFGLYRLVTFDLSQYMRLDETAVKALNLDPKPGDSRTMYLSGLLNKCCTPQGQRLLKQWIKQPLLDKNKIEERLDLVESFYSDVQMRCSMQQEHLKCMPDFFRLIKKLQRGKGTLQDCVRIHQAIGQLSPLLSSLEEYAGPHGELLEYVFLTPLKELCGDFIKYTEMIESTIDLAMVDHHEFVIKPSFDERLSQLRGAMDELEVKINSRFRKAAKELSLDPLKTVKLESSAQHGYFLRVTKKVEKCLRGQTRFIVLETRNDGVKFTTSSLRNLSEEHISLRNQYQATQATLAGEVLEIASGYAEPLLELNHLLAQLDVIVSFAHVSASAPVSYVRPTITPRGEGDIVLRGARHPCLEMQDEMAFIANDVSLLRDKDSFQIITGPNMGGKSTYIKQVGVIVLMAQVGCFVPCESAAVSIVDCILARVGASDSQLKGVSTFMAEMLETAAILRSATNDSLIIIDELGRGTSTYDGFGLAWAISHHISTMIGCFCLFATHFHELTALADEVSTVTNRHVTALTSDETLTLLYRVKPGVCDQSFGIHVAEMVHFPQRVVDAAKKKAAQLEICQSIGRSDEDSEEPLAKRRRSERVEGDRLIAEFLTRVKELLKRSLSEDDLKTEIEEMKKDLVAQGNSYIQAVIDSCS